MKESDWKIFTQLKEKAIEIFCARVFEEFEEIIHNEKEHIHNRYLHHYQLVNNRNKQMRLLFDGHSRSKAFLQLLAIRAENLADENLLGKLSEDFLNETDPARHNF